MYVKVLGSIGEIIHLGNWKAAPSLVSSFGGYQMALLVQKQAFVDLRARTTDLV